MSTASGNPKVGEWELAAMKSLRSDISDMIDCKPMLSLFQQEEIISGDDKDEINRGYPTRAERNDRFLDICFSSFNAGNMTSYQCFVQYCMKNRAYPKMREQLCCRFEKIKSRNQEPPEPVTPRNYQVPIPDYTPGQSSVSMTSPADNSSAGSSVYGRDSPSGGGGSSSGSGWSVLTSPDSSMHQLSPVAEYTPGQATITTPARHSTPIRVTCEGNAAAAGAQTPHSSSAATDAPTTVTLPPATVLAASPRQPSDAETDSIGTTAMSSFNPSSLPTRQSTTWLSSSTSTSLQGSLVAKETAPSESYTPSTPSSMSSGQVVFPASSCGQPSHCEGRLFQPGATSVSPAMDKTATWVAAHKSHARDSS